MADRYTVTIAGQDYVVVPETFVEGSVRRQAEFAYLGEEDLKSRPDTREWLHNSWVGGAQWEKPVYGRTNQNTYFESGDLSFTDRAGAVQESKELLPLSANLSPSAKLGAWAEDGVDGAITFHATSSTLWQWAEWDAAANAFVDVTNRIETLPADDVCLAISAGSDGIIYALMGTGRVAWYDPTANTDGKFVTNRTMHNGASMWVDRDFVWIYNGDKIYRYNVADVPAQQILNIDSNAGETVNGTYTLTLLGANTGTLNVTDDAATVQTAIQLVSGAENWTVSALDGANGFEIISEGTPGPVPVVAIDTGGVSDGTITANPNGDFSEEHAELDEAIADDDDGVDAFSRSADFTGKPLIPEWSCTRAISTSEGIFYVKNVFEGGLTVANVYRVDLDAAGSYILTPIGTLPKGQVAMNIAHHLGSLIISTVPNFHKAVVNSVDQKVTVYHVTGKSIGAIGSPLGGTNVDEMPLWLLGTYDEMLYIGGRRRLWLYDARIGAFHVVHTNDETKYTDHGSGFTGMVSVDATQGASLLFMHTSLDGLAAAPYFELMIEDSLITTSNDSAFVTSNWFDFDLPMEEKTIYEVFYDASDIRTDSTILVQVSADGGAFTTVLTLTGGSSSNTLRLPLVTPITGYKFQYKMVWSTDTVTSSPEPSRVYSLGFAAYGGEMVGVLQMTIDGNESMNIENRVQVPQDVYDALAALRDTKEEIVVVHTMNDLEGEAPVTGTYRVSSVTGRPNTEGGQYEVQLIEVPV